MLIILISLSVLICAICGFNPEDRKRILDDIDRKIARNDRIIKDIEDRHRNGK